jgi:hypothetical protein
MSPLKVGDPAISSQRPAAWRFRVKFAIHF